ncbi:hypothetical protein HDU98_002377, partial [Podochytrium sp. JEL0797]
MLLEIRHFWPLEQASSAVIGRFQQLREISHPSLCECLDVNKADVGYIHTVAAHYPLSLKDHLLSQPKERCDDFELVSRFAAELASALNYLSQNEILHLNLSLKNILLDDSKRIKLSNYWLNHITCGGSLAKVSIGYPENLAPELLCSGTPDSLNHGAKADVWTLGLILVDLCFGVNHRFPAGATLTDFLCTDYSWLSTLKKDLLESKAPPLLIEFIDSCLTIDVTKRPTFETLLLHPLIATSVLPVSSQTAHGAAVITPSDQFQFWKLNGSSSIERILSKHGVAAIPSIERLPCYISVTSSVEEACEANTASGIYLDLGYPLEMACLDPGEIDIPDFSTKWKGFSIPWSASVSGGKLMKGAKPRTPLALKEKNAVYQCFRVLTFKQVVAEWPLSKKEVLEEAALDIAP